MHYRLRTLLIVLAMGPALLAAVWFARESLIEYALHPLTLIFYSSDTLLLTVMLVVGYFAYRSIAASRRTNS